MGNNEGEVAVSVLCMVYNHEPYLRRCLDGFVMQETDFPFEVIVHDDKSTDRSAEIIREYETRYPGIIRPIYEAENQYSKGDGAYFITIDSMIKGRYKAYCEGDDYWCDPHKLQRQYEYMEAHPECTLCVHNSMYHDLSGRVEDHPYNDWVEVHVLTDREIFLGGKIHTSSYFYRVNEVLYPEYTYNKEYWFGDYMFMTLSRQAGEVVALPGIMSVYNAGNPGGVTEQTCRSGATSHIRALSALIDYLGKFDAATGGRFHEAVTERMEKEQAEIDYEAAMLQLRRLIDSGASQKEITACAEILEQNAYLENLVKNQTGYHRLTFQFRKAGYRYCYPLWKKIMRERVLSDVRE